MGPSSPRAFLPFLESKAAVYSIAERVKGSNSPREDPVAMAPEGPARSRLARPRPKASALPRTFRPRSLRAGGLFLPVRSALARFDSPGGRRKQGGPARYAGPSNLTPPVWRIFEHLNERRRRIQSKSRRTLAGRN